VRNEGCAPSLPASVWPRRPSSVTGRPNGVFDRDRSGPAAHRRSASPQLARIAAAIPRVPPLDVARYWSHSHASIAVARGRRRRTQVSTTSRIREASMPSPTNLQDIDLSPRPDKTYFDIAREWREEFIYFLLVDRFHDSAARSAIRQPGRSAGIRVADDFYGGTIRGITQNLDYISGLGCTAIWLSPIFENNQRAYHGYDISNYLNVDPHFGTKQDLIDLVDAAHRRTSPMRIILDVVVNHSGDNWAYPGGVPYYYSDDTQFPFGFWRREDRPI